MINNVAWLTTNERMGDGGYAISRSQESMRRRGDKGLYRTVMSLNCYKQNRVWVFTTFIE